MNELEETLAKILQKGLELAEQTGEFVIDQAPELLQQFYTWHITKYSLGVLLAIAFFVLSFTLPRLWSSKTEKGVWDMKVFNRYYYDHASALIPIIFGCVIGIVILTVNLYSLIFILVAPKLYLIEYFVN